MTPGNSPRTYKGLVLDRFQREAMEAIDDGENVIVAAPTGAGKTLIAEYAIEQVLKSGKRAIYTAPIKALSNQKFRDLSAAYPGQVGISTGDVSINAGAPVVIMTTEIFRNTIFDDPARTEAVSWVIFDEVHYMDDPDRGTVWEESLIFAPHNVRVLALSATVSNLDEFAAWIREVRDSPVRVVLEGRRPVPLTVFAASTEGDIRPMHQVRSLRLGRKGYERRMAVRRRDIRGYYGQAQRKLVQRVAADDQLPLLFFLYSRAACGELALACAREDLSVSPEARKAALAEFARLLHTFELDPTDPELRELEHLVGRGIAYHHAGLLPPLKEVVEQLFSGGHLRLLCATETFALGVNMPARSVAFEGLRKWNGVARVPLKTREFQQMAGRAGRRGIDAEGTVYLTFDPFRDDPPLVTAVVNGIVEPVESQFNLSYGTLLNLYSRLGEGIYQACERSFANFKARQAAKRPKPGKRKGGRRPGRGRRGRRERDFEQATPVSGQRFADVVEQVKIKLGILAELGYLDSEDQITEQGKFAMQVFGHEMEVTELVWSGILTKLTAPRLAVLAVAIVHESRTNVFYGGPTPRKVVGNEAHRLAQRVIGNLIGLEERRGVRQTCKFLDWNMTGPTWAWVHGAEFAELREYSDASDGDVVRTLRQAIQVLRLVGKPLRALRRHEEAAKAKAARGLLKRGLVDAEWQLRRSTGTDDELISEESDEEPDEAAADQAADGEAAPAEEEAAPAEEEAAPAEEEAEPAPSVDLSEDEFSDGIW